MEPYKKETTMETFITLSAICFISVTAYAFAKVKMLGEQNRTRQLLWRIKPGVTTSDNFKKNMEKIGGNIISDTKQSVITNFSSEENPIKKLKGWFHNDRLAVMDIDINGEHEKIYDAVSFAYGEANVNKKCSDWNMENQSEWFRNNLTIYLGRIGNYSSLVIVDNEINQQRLLSNNSIM